MCFLSFDHYLRTLINLEVLIVIIFDDVPLKVWGVWGVLGMTLKIEDVC